MRPQVHQAPQRATRRAWRLPAIGCVSALLLLSGAGIVHVAAEPVSSVALLVFVNPGVNVSHLDAHELRAIFLRKRLVWSNGQHIIPINHPSGDPVRVAFDRAVLGLEPEETGRYWIDARIRSGMQAPRSAPSEALLIRVVMALRGGIGYRLAGKPVIGTGVRVVARIQGGSVLPP